MERAPDRRHDKFDPHSGDGPTGDKDRGGDKPSGDEDHSGDKPSGKKDRGGDKPSGEQSSGDGKEREHQNNGWGNGDQSAPGKSGPNNNAKNRASGKSAPK